MKKWIALFLALMLLLSACAPAQEQLSSAPAESQGSEPPVSEPPVSEPPTSEPPVSEPPVSEPPVSEPPIVTPEPEPEPEPEPQGFVPVLRFAVTSDVHTRTTSPYDYQTADLLKGFFNTAYAYSGVQSYNKLDGVFFVGDITQSGENAEMEKFFSIVNEYTRNGTVSRAVLGNHEFYATRFDDGTTTDSRYSATSVAATNQKLLDYGGYESVDAHLVINGYHFIFLSMDRYNQDHVGSKFNPDKLEWLKQELAAAAATDPTGTKPIFVFQHTPLTGTVNNAAQSSGDDYLEAIFNNYPQVVDFSGHTHMPITDPRSVWQDGFTALNTGGLAYLGTSISAANDKFSIPSDFEGSWLTSSAEGVMRNAHMYYIVEVSAQNEIRLVVYDIEANEVANIIEIGKVGDPEAFTFTDARKDASTAPVWGSGAQITANIVTKNYAHLSLPQAVCDTGVNSYKVELYKGDQLVATTYRISCDFLGSNMPERISAPLIDLESATAYTVKVYPYNHWGKAGTALTFSFTTDSADAAPEADILQTVFNADGTASNGITGKALTKTGSPTVTYDEELGRNVGNFNANGGFCFMEIPQHLERISTTFTMEVYVKFDRTPSGTESVFSSTEYGGWGFQIRNSAEIELLVRTPPKTDFERVRASMPIGEWTHVVATFDNGTLKLYINGELVATAQTTGAACRIPYTGAQYLVVGGESGEYYQYGRTFMRGHLAAANMYADALTEEEVAALYANIQS